jgi:hypothetical protein
MVNGIPGRLALSDYHQFLSRRFSLVFGTRLGDMTLLMVYEGGGLGTLDLHVGEAEIWITSSCEG